MSTTSTIDPTMTVKEIAARHPETVPVFHRFGMDTCCGGGVSVEHACTRDGLDLATVMGALREVLGGSGASLSPASCSCEAR